MRYAFTAVLTLFFSGIFFSPASCFAQQHALFSDLLLDHVEFGLVDYQNLCGDERLASYLEQLAETDPESLELEADRMAFWLNAYNAHTLKIVCEHYPINSINELHSGGLIFGSILNKTVWDKPFITIDGKTFTLNAIEHEILRKKFDDPRIHFALVCAAYSCPPLRYEAYEGETLEVQLNDQARVFLVDKERNLFDQEKRLAWISPIFAWFAGDFGGRENLLTYINEFLPDPLAQDIRAQAGEWKIRHKNYNWTLNDTRLH